MNKYVAAVLSVVGVAFLAILALSAKPVIDMLLVVGDSTDEPFYVPALESEGRCRPRTLRENET